MTKGLLSFFISCMLALNASAQLDSVLYHDMQMETQWGSSTAADQFGCFVRITPPSYPATLRGIRGFFRNADPGSTIKWKVYADPSGMANGGTSIVYLSPAAIPNPATGGIANQQYDAYVDLTAENIVINAGDLYVGAVQTTNFFGAGIDHVPSNNVAPDRQWQWMNIFSTDYWNTMSSQAADGQLGFTAFFSSFGTGMNEMQNEKMNVYVDPAGGHLHIQFPSRNFSGALQIVDVMGRILSEQKVTACDLRIDISTLKAGIYFVSVRSGHEVIQRRIEKP